MPSLNVSDSAEVDGKLILRISLPPSFTSYGVWQNYTIMTCQQECRGRFQSVEIDESAGSCLSIEKFQPFSEENSHHISILFHHLETCFASALFPSLALLVILGQIHYISERNFRLLRKCYARNHITTNIHYNFPSFTVFQYLFRPIRLQHCRILESVDASSPSELPSALLPPPMQCWLLWELSLVSALSWCEMSFPRISPGTAVNCGCCQELLPYHDVIFRSPNHATFCIRNIRNNQTCRCNSPR